MPSPTVITQAILGYLDSVAMARSANTARTYRNALNVFAEVLAGHHLPIETTPTGELPELAIGWMVTELKHSAPATERLYLTAVTGFYEYLVAEELADLNLPQVRNLVRQRARKPGLRLPQFPKEAIKSVLEYVNNFTTDPAANEPERLRLLRDRAFLVTLADTGLRVHEACNLRRGDIDYHEGKAVIIGKGNQEAVVRFSKRSQEAIKAYLTARARLDGGSGKPLGALPLFARHDPGTGKRVQRITTKTGRLIVADWVCRALGEEAAGTITPHSFRHYFVTRVLQGSGNLKLAQELARHRSISVTQRYAHLNDDELDRGFRETIEDP